MKDQYFGDVNDYRKYGLIRSLVGFGQLDIVVCWALTEGDSRTDGSRIGYLREPSKWRANDPVVFDYLREQVLEKGARSVSVIERSKVLPNCRFFGEIVRDDEALRDAYFVRLLRFAEGADLVFFDPDNGIGVKSVERGNRNSSKYVYDTEIAAAYEAGHSVLVYQHFPRRSREPFVQGLVERFGFLLQLTEAFSFRTSHVVFLLLPQERHLALLARKSEEVARRWAGQFRVVRHPVGRVTGTLRRLPATLPVPKNEPGQSPATPAWLTGLESTPRSLRGCKTSRWRLSYGTKPRGPARARRPLPGTSLSPPSSRSA